MFTSKIVQNVFVVGLCLRKTKYQGFCQISFEIFNNEWKQCVKLVTQLSNHIITAGWEQAEVFKSDEICLHHHYHYHLCSPQLAKIVQLLLQILN